MTSTARKDDPTVAALREMIRGVSARELSPVNESGWRNPDADLPRLMGPAPALHEIVADRHGDFAAASGIVLAIAAALMDVHGPVVWVQGARLRAEHGRLSRPGVETLGLPAGRILAVLARRDRDALWALEEALRSGAAACAVGEVEDASFTATRRLALLARAHGAPALLLSPPGRSGATAAQTRLRVATAPGAGARWNPAAPGRARLEIVIEKSAGGKPGDRHVMEWDDVTHDLHLAGQLADRPAAAEPRATPAGGDLRPLRRA